MVGPTGCGKSTTLTLTAGLDLPSAGSVRVSGKVVDRITKGASFVFQTDALLPWKSVVANVALGPIFRGVAKKDAFGKAREWLNTVGLAGFENHFPHQLSGGMRKRVSLAAALINEPTILLMDEPFSALDVQTRAIMANELLTLWERSEPSVMFVTHDLEEAISLADRVVVMTTGPVERRCTTLMFATARRSAGDLLQPAFPGALPANRKSLRDEVERAYSRTAIAAPAHGAAA